MSRTIISIDFDGTIVDHQFPAIGEPVVGAFEWMAHLQAAGARLILFTMRSGRREDGTDPLAEAVEFCRARGIEFWGVNHNPEQTVWTKSPKVYAHVYVDDAALGCPLKPHKGSTRPVVDWAAVGPKLLQMIEDRKAAFAG